MLINEVITEENILNQNIKNLIQNEDFNIYPEFGSDYVYVTKKTGRNTICFLAHYSKDVTGYMSSTYLNPEEATVLYEITNVSDLEVFDCHSEIIEFTDDEIEVLEDVLAEQLIGKQI